ncbi:MAG: hypothetical protein HOP16_09855 [Acidobacteria bacterium]|nr:hypothetical protein [Acidobacteriota bacterium]
MQMKHGTFIANQMRLLVSVQNQQEAEAALTGGADIIDAKNPELGPLGAVSIPTLREIRNVAGRSCPVTAALGDAWHDVAIEAMARAFAGAGASMVKVGFAGVTSLERAASLLSAAVAGAASGSDGACGVVAVAYADAAVVAGLDRHHVLEAAIRCGAEGVLLDTADKRAAGLPELLSPKDIAAWATQAHQAGLLVAVAGKLTPDDLPMMRAAGADIAGVRSAACEGGRTGTVSAERVRVLRALCGDQQRARLKPRTTTVVAM